MTDKELLAYVQRIQQTMTSVATGESMIRDAEEGYVEDYFKIAAEFEDREVINPNPYSSLWEFYSYWSNELPTYQARREYIREMYKSIEDTLRITLANKINRKNSLSKNSNNYGINFDDLHEEIVVKCKDLFLIGKYDEAILNAYKLLEIKVRKKSGLSNSDIGVSLMNKAFSPTQTNFIVSEDNGEVSARMNLLAGAIGSFKNPASHRFNETSQQDAFHIISLASYLLKYVDDLQIRAQKEVNTLEDISF